MFVCSRNNKIFNHFQNSWPDFEWSALSSDQVHQVYGLCTWSFTSNEWNYWWINLLSNKNLSVFSEIKISNPKPTFKDCTA